MILADWFQFNGMKSTILGVYVTTYPPITLPEERVKFVEIPGRSGTLTITESDCVYDDITLSVECLMKDLSKLDEISAWLRGADELVLGNRPGTYYKARVVNQIEISKLVRGRPHRMFSVVFRCAPFRYQYPVPSAISFSSARSITNPGTVYAEPVIMVTGSGDIDLTIGGKTIQLASVSGSITIDVPAKLAYSGSTNLSHRLTGEWPILPTGTFNVSWTGAVSSVSILPHWRFLWDTALEILLIFMVLDYLTGMASAVKRKVLKSSVGYEGLLKKGTVFLMVILAAQLDRIIGNGAGLFRTMTAMFFCANEGLSVLENVGELGVKLPGFIARTLEKLHDDNDPGDQEDQ